jgi:peptide/nickel transport system substrate-binding protein
MSSFTDKLIGTTFRIGMVAILALPALSMYTTSSYAQTPARTMNGFEVSGRFLEVWSKHGSEQSSVYVNGLPITARRSEISVDDGKAYDTQWFERARYEAHPENVGSNDVLLGRLGASRIEGRGKIDSSTGKVANPGDEPFVGVGQPSGGGTVLRWFPETRHTLSGKLLEYWNLYGGLSQFGFPMSEPFQETSQADGKAYTVQYFERNRMELHPEKVAPYDVELGLLGVEQYRARAIPAAEIALAPPKDARTVKEEIKIGISPEPSTLLFTNATLRIRSLIEDQLVGRDDNDNLFPLDAWYVPTLENGGAYFVGSGDDRHLTVKYKLRRGIKWSDGVELTSNDAVFAYKLILNPDAVVDNRAEYEKLQNVDNPDRYTVVYNYRSLSQLRDIWANVGNREKYSHLKVFIDLKKPVISRAYSEVGAIYPAHVLSKIPLSKIADNPIARAPIGTGPYKVSYWTVGQEMVLVPNENYILTSMPLIKKIVLKFVGDSSGMTQVKTGDLDMLISPSIVTPPFNAASLKVAGYNVATRPAATWEHLDFRFDYAPFKEKVVREAISRGINRRRIIDNVFSGAGAVMNSVVPPGVYFSLENPDFARNFPDIAAKYKLPIYSYDPDRARQLLDAAGWVVGPDGIRTKGGVELSFEYGAITQAMRQQIQALVSEDLKSIGVAAIAKNYQSSVFLSESLESPRVNGTTKLAQISSTTTRASDFSAWDCNAVYDPQAPAPPNGFLYCNAALDQLDSKFKSEAGLQAHVAAAAEAQFILMQDIVVVPLIQRPNIEIVRDKLANYKLTNSTNSSFWNARQWYFR